MAAAAILYFQNVGILGVGKGHDGQNASPCQILRRSVKPLLRYGDFLNFSTWRLPPSWIFKMWEF